MNVFPQKHPEDAFAIEIDFSKFSTALLSATVTLSVYKGTDPDPSAMLVGAPTVDGGKVTQRVQLGLSGVFYVYKTRATDGVNWWVDERILPVGKIN